MDFASWYTYLNFPYTIKMASALNNINIEENTSIGQRMAL